MPGPIRVLIVDDHPMMRRGLRSFLAVTPDMVCAGEAGSGEEALELSVQLSPHVVLMDISMPGMGGIAATRLLRQRCPETQVIALTSFDDPNLIQQAVQAGAIGYLLKNVSAATLVEAIRAAAQGRPAMGPEAVSALIEIAAEPRPLGSDLTTREREVLCLLAEGLTNQELARRLDISEATVRFHMGNIFSKLEVGNRTEAVSVAMKLRLVEQR
jgi:NarL family two-component system response regulator LiaR